MAHHSGGFRVNRATLVANTLTPVYAPSTFKCVSIGNATSVDLQVHTHEDGTEYLVIAAGYERLIPVDRSAFSPHEIAFWLKAAAGGTVVVLWY